MSAVIADNLYFISNGTQELYTLSGTSPKQISSNTLSVADNNAVRGIFHVVQGRENYVCTMNGGGGSTDDSYMMHLETGLWTQCGFSTLMYLSTYAGTTYAVDYLGTGGIVYSVSTAPNWVFQDDSVAYTMTIQTEPKVLNKGRGFKINSIELLADNQASGSTTLEISRDDYATFQTLGSFPLTSNRKRITRGGYCRHHAIFRLTDSGNQAWRGQALVVDWEPCAA